MDVKQYHYHHTIIDLAARVGNICDYAVLGAATLWINTATNCRLDRCGDKGDGSSRPPSGKVQMIWSAQPEVSRRYYSGFSRLLWPVNDFRRCAALQMDLIGLRISLVAPRVL
ncbi:hypothetical protein TcWFU_009613 [Taenia crassiceps]|uniref:Uncharacterized protein n=1 Tax=Taenia crassiceps TaxID=6207 RepID=A0ABR4Q9W6_9CEST